MEIYENRIQINQLDIKYVRYYFVKLSDIFTK